MLRLPRLGQGKRLGMSGDGAAPLLLDKVTGSILAVSMRKLKNSYTGNCLKLRRSSDNAELDFGFVNGVVDTAAIATWLGAATGTMVTWYDQCGNDNHVTPVSALVQFTYVANQINTLPVFRGSGGQYATYAKSIIGGDLSLFMVMKLADKAATYGFLSETVTAAERYAIGSTTTLFNAGRYKSSAYLSGNRNSAVDETAFHQLTNIVGATCILYKDSVVGSGTSDHVSSSTTARRIGANTDNSQVMKGDLAEIVVFGSELSAANQAIVEADQNADFF